MQQQHAAQPSGVQQEGEDRANAAPMGVFHFGVVAESPEPAPLQQRLRRMAGPPSPQQRQGVLLQAADARAAAAGAQPSGAVGGQRAYDTIMGTLSVLDGHTGNSSSSQADSGQGQQAPARRGVSAAEARVAIPRRSRTDEARPHHSRLATSQPLVQQPAAVAAASQGSAGGESDDEDDLVFRQPRARRGSGGRVAGACVVSGLRRVRVLQ
jgi:hypothetical protein